MMNDDDGKVRRPHGGRSVTRNEKRTSGERDSSRAAAGGSKNLAAEG
jgi:hypothetical protein